MNNTQEKTFTDAQYAIVKSYASNHGIDAEQISFDGDGLNPSFDHNAISVLSLKLTDIRDISPTEITHDNGTVTVFGKTVLPDGRSRGWIGSCTVGEILANGEKVESTQVAIGVATSRGFRQGIRNVGIDLHKAHQRFLQTGEVDQGNARHDPRAVAYREVHAHAGELDLIVEGDKTKYRQYLADLFDGKTSAKDLDDIQLHQLLVNLRTNVNLKRNRTKAVA